MIIIARNSHPLASSSKTLFPPGDSGLLDPLCHIQSWLAQAQNGTPGGVDSDTYNDDAHDEDNGDDAFEI